MQKKRARKKELEARKAEAFKRLCEGEPCTYIVSAMSEKYSISLWQSRRIVANAFYVVKSDLLEMDINRPEYLSRMLFMIKKGILESLKDKTIQ